MLLSLIRIPTGVGIICVPFIPIITSFSAVLFRRRSIRNVRPGTTRPTLGLIFLLLLFRAGSLQAPLLGVLILDTTTIAGAAAHAAPAPPAPPGVTAITLLVGADADAEEQVGEEQRSPGSPHEAEGVGADPGAAVIALEGVAGFDECGTSVN